jgi:hypothetical protein
MDCPQEIIDVMSRNCCGVWSQSHKDFFHFVTEVPDI